MGIAKIRITLKPGKDDAVKRFHPWVFSGAIKKILGSPKEGDIVEVFDNHDNFLALGHYQIGSIAVRLFSFENINPDKDFWYSKLKKAYEARVALGLVDNPNTNVYRLVYAEGDGMPGMIADYYDGNLVFQFHSIGMYLLREMFAEIMQEIYGGKLKTVYDKSSETLPHKVELSDKSCFLLGSNESAEVREYGIKMKVDWVNGQKTGFFIDQRENRKLLADYSKGKRVLNTFCYTGGFSTAALSAGASVVHSVDCSKKAIDLTAENLKLNNFDPDFHSCIAKDTMDFFRESDEKYDIIVLDPPAYAKHKEVKHNAIQGYKRLNAMALEKIAPGGLLFTFSCSQVVERFAFNSAVLAAAIQVGRNVRIVHQMSQPADHPINIYHQEGEYLKGLVLYVE